MRDNPLAVLGIPKAVVVHAHTTGQYDIVSRTIQATYRAYGKILHPDVGGDESLWVALGEALKELSDPDALSYFIKEWVGETDVMGVRRKKVADDNRRDLETTIHSLTHGIQFADQFRLLGITQPTTFVTLFGLTMMVLDVKSPTLTLARLVAHSLTEFSNLVESELNYKKGQWSELVFKSERARRKTRVVFDEFAVQKEVTLIGYAPVLSLNRSIASDKASLEAGPPTSAINWESPASAWFMPKLRLRPDDAHHFGFVACKAGRVAHLGMCLASAPL